ncbi:DUF4345 family protein [Candidatus Halocynthiibacter alkanivorans]|uniref:DUF4345 family protein n=1 Tax=Candidatus Halocynthiibacter alkanivorans TaxID=2267619 RepID=UPI00109D6705|nr:DUF4345 family protein [Candidatus Halocynthiibacter alkanivorans]
MTKTNIGRSIFALIALFFIGIGLSLMLAPALILDHMLVEPVETAAELSSIRALWGGVTFAVWASVLLGAVKANPDYILVGFIAMPTVIFTRLVGYYVDGAFPEFVSAVLPAVFVLILMLIAHKLMASSTNK